MWRQIYDECVASLDTFSMPCMHIRNIVEHSNDHELINHLLNRRALTNYSCALAMRFINSFSLARSFFSCVLAVADKQVRPA